MTETVTATQALAMIRKSKRTALEDRLIGDLAKLGLPAPVREYRFASPRKWRFDLCYPGRKLGIECDGGTWSGGRHVTGAGYERDSDKLNAANLLGYTCLRYTAAMVKSGQAAREIASALEVSP